MHDLFWAYVKDPTQQKFTELRSALIESAEYDPSGDQLEEIERLFDEGEHAKLLELGRESLGTYLLSPRLHHFLRLSAEASGDAERAGFERYLCRLCFEGILGTGDGSEGHPYLVTSSDDEHDVLSYLGKTAAATRLLEGERSCDVVRCDDGEELWFDVTDPLFRLQARETKVP